MFWYPKTPEFYDVKKRGCAQTKMASPGKAMEVTTSPGENLAGTNGTVPAARIELAATPHAQACKVIRIPDATMHTPTKQVDVCTRALIAQ